MPNKFSILVSILKSFLRICFLLHGFYLLTSGYRWLTYLYSVIKSNMAKNLSTLTLHTTVQKVWDALINPELVKQWQYGSNLVTDWKVGSSIRFSTPWEGKTFEQWGIVLEMIPHKKISYSLFAPAPGREDKPENYFIMNFSLTEVNGNVKLEIIQEDNRPGAKQEAVQGEENPVLKGLKALIESL